MMDKENSVPEKKPEETGGERPMPVTCTQEDRCLSAAVSGELDHHRARAIMEELDQQIDAALPRELTLDLSGLTFTDSSGIAVLLRAWKRMGQLGGSLRVIGTPPQADKVFRAAGLQRMIRFE